MNRFTYRVFHQTDGRDARNRLASGRTTEQIARDLDRVALELLAYLSDPLASVAAKPWPPGTPTGRMLTIDSVLDETMVGEAVGRCVDGLNLSAERLEHP